MAVGTIQGHSLNLSNLNLLSSFIIHVSVCRVVEKKQNANDAHQSSSLEFQNYKFTQKRQKQTLSSSVF